MKNLIIFSFVFLLIVSERAFAQTQIELLDSYELVDEAVKLTDLGKYDAAIEKFKKVPENDTNYNLASYEYAFCLSAAKRYDQAIEIAREAIKKDNDNTHLFYMILGNCLDDINKSEEALLVYDEGIAKFPNLFLLHYNKALTLNSLERYDDAIVELKKCLLMNNQHVRSHFLLGDINARHGRMVQAMLCFNMAAMLQNEGDISKDCIGRLENLVNNKYERLNTPLKPCNDESESFEEVLTLLESGIALNEKFKSKTKLNFDVIKQDQVLFESLRYDASSKDFYMQTYVKFFAEMISEGYLVPYSYHILSSYEITKVKDYLVKNKATIDKFVGWAGKTLTESSKYKEGQRCHYYENQVIYANGSFSDNAEKLKDGKWVFYFPNGNKKTEGMFSNGEKTGAWTYYYNNGVVKVIEKYKDGKQDGLQKEFYESGKISLEYNLTNEELDGKYNRYYQNGQVSETGEFATGVLIGQQIYYFVNGVVRTALNFVDGENDGYNKECYPSGKTYIEVNYLKGEFNGDFKKYYENGKLIEEYIYKNGRRSGNYKTYYYSGQLEQEGLFDEKGKLTGMNKSYHYNGNISIEEQYVDGALEGESRYYDVDGILYSVTVYKNKRVFSMKYLNKAGEQISFVEVPKGKQALKTYQPEGNVAGEGSYYDNWLQGKWKYYDRNGVLENEKEYKEGIMDGEVKSYHPNGQIETSYKAKQGDIDGYYKSFYINGQIESEGWYVDDMQQGVWKSYYINGKPESVNYYLNDEPFGQQKLYHYNGNLATIELWDEGIFNGIIKYDSVGKVWASCKLSDGSGHYLLQTTDGKILETADFVNGNRVDSTVDYFYANQKKCFAGFYISDRREGLFNWYYSDGKKRVEANYLFGRQEGEEVFYYPNGNKLSMDTYLYDHDNGLYQRCYPSGKLRIESQYVDGQREGNRKIFNSEGTEMFRMKYVEDNPVCITYLDQSGKETKPVFLGTDSVHITTKYPSGQKSADFSFKAGVFNGAYTEYYPSGKPQTETTYYYGQFIGPFRYYFPNGKLWYEETYLYGDLTGPRKEYYENGKLRFDENLENSDLNGYARYYDETGKLIRLAYFYYNELIYEYIY